MIVEDKDFIGKIWPQNCGDSLLVIEKTDKKYQRNYYYRCQFKKYPYEILALKGHIIRKQIVNPEIERIEFLEKEWLQNCGDYIKIIDNKVINKKGVRYFNCEFQKYPYKCLAKKVDILKGSVINPNIEKKEFIDKIWPQSENQFLKIIKKTSNKRINDYLWECVFVGYEDYKILACKQAIKNGNVLNPNYPLHSKEKLKSFILNKYKDKKPSLRDLAEDFNLKIVSIGQVIQRYGLKDLIYYHNSSSYIEEDILNYIKIFLKKEKIETSNWEILDKEKEIDIYISDLKLGFEFNGNYWHSEIYKKQNYHQKKSLLAKTKGINLVHIFEYEWNEKQEIIKSLIKSKLGIFKKRVYARQCEIKELNYQEYAQFCNENHLQGEAGAKVKLGLYHKEELIQIMSFSLPRFTDKYEWEIIRECSKLGYIVLGGKEKLWSYFIKKYNPNSVISYCDFSKFNGESYLRLGFKSLRLNKPGFVWFDKNFHEVFWRNPYKNQEFKSKEFYKLYDCGQLVFEWNK